MFSIVRISRRHLPLFVLNLCIKMWHCGLKIWKLKTIIPSFVKYCFHNSKIKSISSQHRVISSIYLCPFISTKKITQLFLQQNKVMVRIYIAINILLKMSGNSKAL